MKYYKSNLIPEVTSRTKPDYLLYLILSFLAKTSLILHFSLDVNPT